MASDADWLEDVRRWALGEAPAAAVSPAVGDTPVASFNDELGYEAAHPALQARHWPDALPLKS